MRDVALMSVKDTAKALKVPTHQIYYELRRDHCYSGMPVVDVGRRLYFRRDDVLKRVVSVFQHTFQ
jgi:hypothetical protein